MTFLPLAICGVIAWAIIHDVCRAIVDCRRAMFGKNCCCCEPQDESVDVDTEEDS